MQVVDTISDNVYKVQDLGDKEYVVHAARMWFYDGKDYVPEEDVDEIFHNDWGELEVEELRNLRVVKGQYEIETKWLGFEEISWEPVEHLNQFIPEYLQDYLEKGISTSKRKIFLGAQRALRVHEQQFENNKKVRRIQVQKQSNKAPKTRDWLPEKTRFSRSALQSMVWVGTHPSTNTHTYLSVPVHNYPHGQRNY